MDLRKIDALVAENVLGWTDANPPRGCLCGLRERCATCVWPGHLSYSSDLAAAWEVVRALNAQGFGVSADALPTEEGSVSILERRGDGSWHTVAMAQAATVPLAICLAALKAKGIAVE